MESERDKISRQLLCKHLRITKTFEKGYTKYYCLDYGIQIFIKLC